MNFALLLFTAEFSHCPSLIFFALEPGDSRARLPHQATFKEIDEAFAASGKDAADRKARITPRGFKGQNRSRESEKEIDLPWIDGRREMGSTLDDSSTPPI